MAIEVAPERKIKVPFWVIVLYGIILVLFLFLAGSGFYFYTLTKKLEKEIKEKEKQIIPTAEERALEQDVVLKAKRIKIFSELLSGHKKINNVFSLIESFCLPKVQFTDFKLDTKKNLLSLSGKADNFITLAQQIMVLSEEKFIKSVSLSQIGMTKEGNAEFGFEITLDPKIYYISEDELSTQLEEETETTGETELIIPQAESEQEEGTESQQEIESEQEETGIENQQKETTSP